jgi:hypothetical protein
MKTAISDDEAKLLNMAQRDYDNAGRMQFAAESCVARVLKISHHKAAEMLKMQAIEREIIQAGVEVYQVEHCRSPWPDSQTLGMWFFMVAGLTLCWALA